MNLHVDGRDVRVTNPDRVMWPATGTTKADVLRYYTEASAALLPLIAGHPVALHRFPEGVGAPHFYQIRAPSHPPWVPTTTVRSPRGKAVEMVLVEDLATLLWAANLGSIELHPYLGTADDFYAPTQVVVDLDPGPPAGVAQCAAVALVVHDALDQLGLAHVVKSSGGKGLHLHIPVRDATYEATKAFGRAIAEVAAEQLPHLVVTSISKSARTGRVYVDWGQNDAWKSTVAPWSLRGGARPTIAAPLSWTEVEQLASSDAVAPPRVHMADAEDRRGRHADELRDTWSAKQRLPIHP